MNDFQGIKALYRAKDSDIRRVGANRYGADPYCWSGLVDMTPIEYAMWCDFRSLGIVMYPQYPVGKYFVDFGNPVAKVAIECDGAAYHTDKAADKSRHKKIESLGWNVYRFTGRECNEVTEEVYGDDETTYGRLRAIAAVHNLSSVVQPSEELHAYFLSYETPRIARWA
jgi:very-short-patch-repair endonuclease